MVREDEEDVALGGEIVALEGTMIEVAMDTKITTRIKKMIPGMIIKQIMNLMRLTITINMMSTNNIQSPNNTMNHMKKLKMIK